MSNITINFIYQPRLNVRQVSESNKTKKKKILTTQYVSPQITKKRFVKIVKNVINLLSAKIVTIFQLILVFTSN